jgi:hypothetical protein
LDEVLFSANVIGNYFSYFTFITEEEIRVIVYLNGHRHDIVVPAHKIPRFHIDEGTFIKKITSIVKEHVFDIMFGRGLDYCFSNLHYSRKRHLDIRNGGAYGAPIFVDECFFDSIGRETKDANQYKLEWLKGVLKDAVLDKDFREYVRSIV